MKEIKYTILYYVCENFCDSISLQFRFLLRYGKKFWFRFRKEKNCCKGVAGSGDPDPFVRGADPGIRIRIRTKMLRIRNTGKEATPPTNGVVMKGFLNTDWWFIIVLRPDRSIPDPQQTLL